MDRRSQRRLCKLGRMRQGHADKAFHVASAPPIEQAVAHLGLKRVGAPGLPVNRHHVGVARQHDTARPFAKGGEEVGLAAIGVEAAAYGGAMTRQNFGRPVNQR